MSEEGKKKPLCEVQWLWLRPIQVFFRNIWWDHYRTTDPVKHSNISSLWEPQPKALDFDIFYHFES